MADLISVLFLGVVVGSLYALTASGLVLTYRTSGVFNFAHGAVGMFFAYLFFQLTQGGRVNLLVAGVEQSWRLPVPVALVLVVGVLAPALGWALDVVLFRRLRRAGSVVKMVATIGVLVSLQGLAGVIWGGNTELVPRSIFPRRVFAVGGLRISVEEIATVLLAFALCAGLIAFLRTSSLGVRMRAVVDRPELAELMRVDSGRVSAVAWAIGSGFAALAGILLVPFFGSLDPFTLSLLVITAAAAAVVGRLESLPLTLLGALGIGIAQFLVQRYASTDLSRQLQPSIPFLVLFLSLMLPMRFREIGEAPRPGAGGERPDRPGPAGRSGLILRVVLLGAILVLVPFQVSRTWQSDLATVPPTALLFLSLVLLSGIAGQVSLSQAAFAGFGAFVAAHLVADNGWPFLLAAVIGAVSAVPLGGLLASRATRLPPLFLGFATLAFAAVMDQVAFSSQSFSGGLSGIFFSRPSFLESPRAYYLFTLGVFGLFALLIRNLRAGRTGLALEAMRDSPAGLAAVGESTARLKFVAFCVSAFMAGLAGALLAGASQVATPYSFFTVQSLLVLALAVVGGIRSWTGALAGAALFQLAAPFVHQPFIRDNVVARLLFHGQLEALLPVFFGLAAIGLAQNPGGIVEQLRDVVAWIRRATSEVRGLRAAPEVIVGGSKGALAVGGRPRGPAALVAFPHGRLYHRATCVLTTGKEGRTVEPDRLDGLWPCPVCGPERARA